MKKCFFSLLISLILLVGICTPAYASGTNAVLYDMYSDNMLFQQNAPSKISGTATNGSKIEIEIYNSKNEKLITASAQAKNNCFSVEFLAPKGSFENYSIVVKENGKEFRTLKNVVFGELWIASGQSNMHYPLGQEKTIRTMEDIGTFKASPYIRSMIMPTYDATIDGKSYTVVKKRDNLVAPNNYEEKNNSFNTLHPNNKGFFFYIGARAENKFLNDYNYDFSKYKIRNNVNYDYCEKVDKDYFSDDYIIQEQTIEKENLSLNNGVMSNSEGYFEIEADNKYLFFNKSKDGFDVDTWDEDSKYVLTGITRPNINLYLLLNKTKTGYTVDNIDEYFEKYKSKTVEQVVKKDIINNAFGLRIKDDGSIGYRYIIEEDKIYYLDTTLLDEPNREELVCNSVREIEVTIKDGKLEKKALELYDAEIIGTC